MRRYWQAYRIMLRNSLIREMSFKANFLLWIVVEICWFAGQIIFIEVLYSHVEAIGDWTKWEMILLVATHQLVGQLFQAFFFVNLAEIPERIRTGSLDFMLMLPLDTQFSVSTRQFGLDNIVNALVSLAIVAFSLVKLQVQPGPGAVALYLTAVGFGIAIHYALMLTLTTVSFWIVRAQGLISGYFSFSSLGRYPDVIFRGGVKFFFSWVIPIILVANVPARFLVGTFSGPVYQPLLHLAFAALLVLAGSRLFWKFALSRYTSASS
ncbi:MAG TPA: ABC-2 family transporter protein [Chthoniobacteraceae bacterium]|nr:ABC-2 family transporter protein [Chthoniobacteraceae bacterium]